MPETNGGRLDGFVFKRVLPRLGHFVRSDARIQADASQELRTPLTIIHGEAQVS